MTLEEAIKAELSKGIHGQLTDIVNRAVRKGYELAEAELVHCKDCKHCNREIAVGEWEGSCRYWNTHSVMLNDFCSRAERKEKDGE